MRRRHHRQPVGEGDGVPGERGFDAGKLVNGRKRSIILDTLGMLLRVVVHPADVSDLVGGRWVAALVDGVSSRLTKLFGSRHYGGQFAAAVARDLGWEVEVIRRPADVGSLPGAAQALDRGARLRLANPVSSAGHGL